jgi:hypothetical protein
MHFIKDKFKLLIALTISSGLLSLLNSQLLYFHRTNEINVDKILLGIWPLLFVIVFLYQKSKFGFGLALFYLLAKLSGAIMVLWVYGSQLGFSSVVNWFPENISEILVVIISTFAISICFDYWKRILK